MVQKVTVDIARISCIYVEFFVVVGNYMTKAKAKYGSWVFERHIDW